MQTPRFKAPLARAILDDPAFSPDPRAHPHWHSPLANARSCAAPLPLSPDGPPSRSSSLSSDSDSLPSPAVSSATSPSPSPPPSAPVSPHPPPQRPRPLPVPEILPRPRTLARPVLKPVQTNIPRKSRMKAFVRRLTARHNLDRIDELDETDPFGSSYHHDGPYEAIGSNFTMYAPRRGNTHPSRRESDPCHLRPGPHQFAPSAHVETGLSLHLEPGQILQQNTIYSFHASSIAAVPDQFRPQPDTASITTRPDQSRRQSLPNPRTRSHEHPSPLDLRDSFQNPQPSSLRAPRECFLRDHTPDTPIPPLHHDHDAVPYVLHQTEKTVFPPPRYASRLHTSGPPRPPQPTPPPSFHPTSPKSQSTESAAVAWPRHDSRHKSVHSLGSSNSTITQSSIRNKPLDPPRMRHLPKRLVMPAPLQPQPPQPQYNFPPAEPPAWQYEYPDHHALEGAHFQGRPAMYSQEPRLLRKKSSAFPTKTPIPDHVPMPQDDPLPTMGNYPTKSAKEAEGAKESTRRRRLSKRKSGI